MPPERCVHCHHAMPELRAADPAAHDLLACRDRVSEQLRLTQQRVVECEGVMERLRSARPPLWRVEGAAWMFLNTMAEAWERCDLFTLLRTVRYHLQLLAEAVNNLRVREGLNQLPVPPFFTQGMGGLEGRRGEVDASVLSVDVRNA